MLLVASETGHVYTFATPKLQPMITSESGKALIQTCLNTPDAVQMTRSRMLSTGFEETDLAYGSPEEEQVKSVRRLLILWEICRGILLGMFVVVCLWSGCVIFCRSYDQLQSENFRKKNGERVGRDVKRRGRSCLDRSLMPCAFFNRTVLSAVFFLALFLLLSPVSPFHPQHWHSMFTMYPFLDIPWP